MWDGSPAAGTSLRQRGGVETHRGELYAVPHARGSATRITSGRVLTYFGRVGTVGMERGYSWSFVPFQAVRVHTEFPGNRATDPNRN